MRMWTLTRGHVPILPPPLSPLMWLKLEHRPVCFSVSSVSKHEAIAVPLLLNELYVRDAFVSPKTAWRQKKKKALTLVYSLKAAFSKVFIQRITLMVSDSIWMEVCGEMMSLFTSFCSLIHLFVLLLYDVNFVMRDKTIIWQETACE